MTESKPPLFDFFVFMRDEAGLPLTIDQYHILLQALEGGFGISSPDDLKQVCRLLWIKSTSSAQAKRFEEYLERYFKDYFAQNSQDLDSQDSQLQLKKENSQRSEKETSPDDSPEEKNSRDRTKTNSELGNSPQIATAMRGEMLPEEPFYKGRYQLTIQDFPATRRQIQQNWRYLRRPIREGALTEIDIEATIEQIIADGVFLEPVLIPRYVNRVEMLLLIDESNSMVPFRLLYEKIVTTLQGSRLGCSEIYYFRNCPRDYLYLYPRRPDAKKIDEILPSLHRNRTVVVIISDGGAARGGINGDRIKFTKEFVDLFNPYVRHLAWLNPMPFQRWEYTSAEVISQFVQMFELDRLGLKAAMRSLKV